jgi:hypothetical protein
MENIVSNRPILQTAESTSDFMGVFGLLEKHSKDGTTFYTLPAEHAERFFSETTKWMSAAEKTAYMNKIESLFGWKSAESQSK